MIVRFVSSETGEVLMFAEVAKILMDAMGKPTTARGAFVRDEMPAAAAALKAAVERAEHVAPPEEDEEKPKEPVVALRQRAWPLIDMLERTARSGPDANIVWEAAADF